MKIEHLSNSFVKLGSELFSQIDNCSDFSIATAFIDDTGITVLEHSLRKNKELRQGKLLIGVYGYFNSKACLISLKNLGRKFSGKFQVRISKDPSFHWKYYGFEFLRTSVLYVGSANFTSGGLGKNGELIVKLSDKRLKKNGPIEKLKSSFDTQWENSGPLSEFPIDKYPETKRTRKPVSVPKELSDFFKKNKAPRNAVATTSDNVFVYYLTDYVKTSTTKKVYGYNPSWEKNDVDFFVCNRRSFNNALSNKKLLIIHRESRNNFFAHWATVVGHCDEIRTEDGKYFIAYKSGKTKRLNLKVQAALSNEFGIDLRARKNPFDGKVLRKRQVDRMKNLFLR